MPQRLDRLREALQAIWRSGDLVLIFALLYAAGGVISSALLSRDFLVGTDLKYASSWAAVDSLDCESLTLDAALQDWRSAGTVQQGLLRRAITSRPEAAIKLAEANRNAEAVLAGRILPSGGGHGAVDGLPSAIWRAITSSPL